VNPYLVSAFVACGGAVGALSRFWLSVGLSALAGKHLPFATFTVNVAGSFLIGIAAMTIGRHAGLTAFAIVGILGGFTTFSTFSLETVRLMEDGRMVEAAGYAGLSVVVCVAAATLGAALGRLIAG